MSEITQRLSASASTEVSVDPDTAFKVFTEETRTWWARGPANFYDGARALGTAFEGGVGGRFLEEYPDGERLEIGEITAWEPGARIVYRSLLDDSEVEIVFAASSAGTRVSIEQRVIPDGGFGKSHLWSGWNEIVAWYGRYADGGPGNGSVTSRDLPRLSPMLFYSDLRLAYAWLERVFGLVPRGLLPGHADSVPELAELALGDSVVMCRRSADPPGDRSQHMVYAYVDDLDGHRAHSQAEGAKIVEDIHQHGDRTYVAADCEGHLWTFAQARPTQRGL
ncbi:MAG TPA: VOC family protein [Acidimicrobiales bacterium]|jgi:uncharacterized glyoxalase superfamily protein PhnB|nr:VOC family protein [Acidimicrobiales bacterium]